MIIRVLKDKKVVIIYIGIPENKEQAFIDKNPTTDYRIISEIPPSVFQKWKEVDGEIVVDEEEQALAEQEVNNKENRKYLSGTDWYITRNTETGVEIPADILTKRQSAREAIV
jgi:hypothetical protein